jgi:hypothetical protein
VDEGGFWDDPAIGVDEMTICLDASSSLFPPSCKYGHSKCLSKSFSGSNCLPPGRYPEEVPILRSFGSSFSESRSGSGSVAIEGRCNDADIG